MNVLSLLRSLIERGLVRDVQLDVAGGTITFHRHDSLVTEADQPAASLMMEAALDRLRRDGFEILELDRGRLPSGPYIAVSFAPSLEVHCAAAGF